MEDIIYDVIIIGGGPAGLTAGIYVSRARLKSLLIDNYGINGQLVSADNIENYPGFTDGISGVQLIKNFRKQAEKFGLGSISQAVVSINYTGKKIEITTDDKIYSAMSLIIATGAKPKRLGIPGENDFTGKGVSYCATCDAAFFKNKTVAVIGGGDTAVEEALFLTKFADKVLVVHRRDKLRATKILQERAFTNKKINFIWNSQITEITGDKKVENISVRNVKTLQNSKINTDGVFIFAGYTPNTDFLKNTLKLDENGFILTGGEMETDRAGIFAAGDCRKKLFKQVITACGDGAAAAFSAEKYLDKLKDK